MGSFVTKPNLPENADIVLLGEKYRRMLDSSLREKGLRPIYVPDNPFVDDRLSGHADLSVLHLGGNSLFIASFLKNSCFSEKMRDLGFEIVFSDIQMDRTYPLDAMLNICICGNRFFYNPKSADRSCVEILRDRGLKPLSVRQGYTKCAICVVNESSIITSDKGIHSIAVKAGLSSLLITEAHIVLEGFAYGFIGGSTFVPKRDKLAFIGNIHTHPDCKRIVEFLENKGIEPINITENNIFDAGSILPLTEK